jgi:hypothetical protein
VTLVLIEIVAGSDITSIREKQHIAAEDCMAEKVE